MHLSTLRRPAQALVAGIAALALYAGAGIGPAGAQTREHVLLGPRPVGSITVFALTADFLPAP